MSSDKLSGNLPTAKEHIASTDVTSVYSIANGCLLCKVFQRQGHRQLELHSSLISFLALVQNRFSVPDAVLLPAEDG